MALLLLMPVSAKTASVNEKRAAEPEVKAAFIYNFSKFVNWPSASFQNDTSPIHICIVDDLEISEAFEAFGNKMSKGRQIQVIPSGKNSGFDKCHLLFIGRQSDHAATKKILASVAKRAVLTIGDSPAFVAQGGMIGFLTSENRVIFEINPKTAMRCGLEISSKLLGVARIAGDLP